MREGNFNFVARDYTFTDYGRTENKRLLNVWMFPLIHVLHPGAVRKRRKSLDGEK
jgi:hypothetical protein